MCCSAIITQQALCLASVGISVCLTKSDKVIVFIPYLMDMCDTHTLTFTQRKSDTSFKCYYCDSFGMTKSTDLTVCATQCYFYFNVEHYVGSAADIILLKLVHL